MGYAIESMGWLGMAALLFAYWRRVRLGGMAYALLNLSGASAVCAVCVLNNAWPAAVLEATWALIAAGDVVRARRVTATGAS